MRTRTEIMAIPIVAVVLGILFLVVLTAEWGVWGWVLFGIGALIALAVILALLGRRHRHPSDLDAPAPRRAGDRDGKFRVLVVSDGRSTSQAFHDEVVAHAAGRPLEVLVVAPALGSRLAHWTGELPVLTVKLNWAYRTFQHIFGSFTYRGKPVHGFKSTSVGEPLDTFGRNLYVDTFNSAYGPGWKRENSFLMHKGTGKFCYGFYSHGARPVGAGTRYRATIIGPGVTPDVYWESEGLGTYDKDFDLQMHEEQKSFYAGDSLCKAV